MDLSKCEWMAHDFTHFCGWYKLSALMRGSTVQHLQQPFQTDLHVSG